MEHSCEGQSGKAGFLKDSQAVQPFYESFFFLLICKKILNSELGCTREVSPQEIAKRM